MSKRIMKKFVSIIMICALTVTGLFILPKEADGADELMQVDTTDWKKSIAIDFGVTNDFDEGNNSTPQIAHKEMYQIKHLMPDVEIAETVEGTGNWLYEKTTIQDVYETTALTEQKMGFDRVVPAGITTAGGNYFKDWIFSPDGEEYSFKVDLPVGQYYVAIYTGNYIKDYDNTTCVRFNDESFIADETEYPVVYDQTSDGGYQFYKDTKEEFIYVVDVKDNGQGYGTLKAAFFDDTQHDNSHKLTVGDVLNVSAEKEHGVKSIDLYKGTESEISKENIEDKLITARLNGIEITPIENPVHCQINHNINLGGLIQGVGGVGYLKNEDVTDRTYFISTNPSAALVDTYSGKLEGVGVGNATIYEYNTYDNHVLIRTVEYIPAKTVSLDKEKLHLKIRHDIVGLEQEVLTATYNHVTHSHYTADWEKDIIEWSVSDEGIICFEKQGAGKDPESGLIKSSISVGAIGPGQTVITARRTDTGSVIAQCDVYVTMGVKDIDITDGHEKVYAKNEVITIKEGEKLKIGTTMSPKEAMCLDTSFSSSDSNIAEVTADGYGATIYGASPGEAIITASSIDNPKAKTSIKVIVTSDSKNPQTQVGNDKTNPPSNPPADQNKNDTKVKITLGGKKTTKIKSKKMVEFEINAGGLEVKKTECVVKSGKKLVTVKTTKKAIKVKAKKSGTVKLAIKVITKDKKTKTFKRTIKIK